MFVIVEWPQIDTIVHLTACDVTNYHMRATYLCLLATRLFITLGLYFGTICNLLHKL